MVIFGLKTKIGIFALNTTLDIGETPYHFINPNLVRKRVGLHNYEEWSYQFTVTSHNFVNTVNTLQ